jgi:hypothetical protein
MRITKGILAVLLGVAVMAIPSLAQARQHHHRAVAGQLDPGCNVIFPCTPMAGQTVRGRGLFDGIRSIRVTMHRDRTAHRRAPVARQVASYGAPSPSLGYTLGKPSRYIAGRLICAINVGVALAERGIKGTGSARALSYLHWGHSAGGPRVGAVIVSGRRGGGHVAIVSRIENGVVYAWNATGGQSGWREIPYRHSVIDYRVPD